MGTVCRQPHPHILQSWAKDLSVLIIRLHVNFFNDTLVVFVLFYVTPYSGSWLMFQLLEKFAIHTFENNIY